MNPSITEIWISSEHTNPVFGEKFVNDNADAIVIFSDDSKYVATFFTYENIQWLREKNKQTGECLSGRYFWASDMILIDRVDRESITTVIDNLLLAGDFHRVFQKID